MTTTTPTTTTTTTPTTPTTTDPVTALAGVVERLSRSSQRSAVAIADGADWPDRIDPCAAWCFTPEWSSLYGTDAWHALDPAGRQRLAFHEAANFFSLNIHGEKALMQGLAERLYRPDLAEVAQYLHHFLDEENKHSVYFGRFCRRYARIYPSRQVPFEQPRPRGEADVLFFAKALVFEELADAYNRVQAADERLHPLVRWINHQHHVDEARHLHFGRRLLAALWEMWVPRWGPDETEALRRYVDRFFTMTWRAYYNPDVYADCGFTDPWATADAAWASPHQREHRRRASARALRSCREAGVLDEEPTDAF
jgi:P-aminobenzoate N-oxygenase AurF